MTSLSQPGDNLSLDARRKLEEGVEDQINEEEGLKEEIKMKVVGGGCNGERIVAMAMHGGH